MNEQKRREKKRLEAQQKKQEMIDTFYDTVKISSATECTGLAPAAVINQDQAEEYGEMYAIHAPKVTEIGEDKPHTKR